MKLAIKLAYRNLMGAGLRTWLNVIVLSFSFIVIIWMKGVMVGWDHQAKTDMKNWQIGNGQLWHNNYDPYDIFTLDESHSTIPKEFKRGIDEGIIVPILITRGTIYPEGRMQPTLIKGIPANQKTLELPTHKLDTAIETTPALIGTSMARANNLKKGDYVTLQWRDVNGMFDATEIYIADIFATNVPAVDAGQIWINIDTLRSMFMMGDEATLLTLDEQSSIAPTTDYEDWTYKPVSELTAEIDNIIKTKSVGQSVFYIILMLLAMLAIFDTQVLSIFRRQKEIGTYIALGYTRQEVVGLFTVEGAMHSILAALVAALYGIPFLWYQAKAGWTLPMDSNDFGIAMTSTIYPVYTLGLIIGTTLIVVITTTIVSYWPSRKIAKMNPTQALRGKIQ